MTKDTLPLGSEQAFLATASHEIRTPLNGILGMVSLLLETELNASQREYAEAIRTSGSRLLDLLNNVLDFARLDGEGVQLATEVFDPVLLAQEVAELLAPRAHEKGLDLAILPVQLRLPMLMGDSGRIRQVLFNLIGNALKFTQTGGILVDLSHQENRFTIRIVDSGPGIPAKAQGQLFEAFRQTDAKDAQNDGGVGLGLAIVKRLCDLMGGEVSLESEVGRGTCFTVNLPIEAATTASERPANDPLAGQVALIGLPPATRLAIGSKLMRAGMTVLTYGETWDNTLLEADLILAGADMSETHLSPLLDTSRVLIVMRPEDRGRLGHFKKQGAIGWLVRPVRAATLVERVGIALKGELAPEEELLPRSGQGRIVIADDNPINALLAQRALESSGFNVTLASTGREALDAIAQISPHLVLMDIRMPIMDGFEAMKQLRLAGNQVPVIAVSAEMNPEIEDRARQAGANGVAAKPLDADSLRRLAIKWTHNAEQAGAA